jgi:hypothetical protein
MTTLRPSLWLLRSQEQRNVPAPLSFNSPVVKRTNTNNRVAYAPMKAVPKKTRKNRKSHKTRKAGTRRR